MLCLLRHFRETVNLGEGKAVRNFLGLFLWLHYRQTLQQGHDWVSPTPACTLYRTVSISYKLCRATSTCTVAQSSLSYSTKIFQAKKKAVSGFSLHHCYPLYFFLVFAGHSEESNALTHIPISIQSTNMKSTGLWHHYLQQLYIIVNQLRRPKKVTIVNNNGIITLKKSWGYIITYHIEWHCYSLMSLSGGSV